MLVMAVMMVMMAKMARVRTIPKLRTGEVYLPCVPTYRANLHCAVGHLSHGPFYFAGRAGKHWSQLTAGRTAMRDVPNRNENSSRTPGESQGRSMVGA